MTAAPGRVVITGASSGIGAALAREYGRRGATLGLIARRKEPLDALASSLGVAASTHATDVRDVPALRAAAADFVTRFGAPDVVIANAGVSRGTLTQHAEDLAAFQAVFDTNVMGMVNTFQVFLPAMQQAGTGTLVGIASVAGFRGLPGAGAYSASKAAAMAYLESLRVELRGSGMKVVTICPGYIDTPMTERNPYRMPFLLPADEAARRFARAIDRGASLAVIPWQMNLVARVLRRLPNVLYDRLFENAPRKPR